jgi:hypothetical protein
VIKAATRWLLVVVILLSAGPTTATTVAVGTDPIKFVMKGKIVTPDQVVDGELCTAPGLWDTRGGYEDSAYTLGRRS